MINRIVDFLCVCSGARKDALRRAPNGRTQSATLGTLMLLTSIVSMLTAGYAIHEAFLGSSCIAALSVGGGVLWGAVVYSIEKLIILGVDKFASPARIALQLLIRLPLAVVVAMVISEPLVLKLCETVIGRELRKEAHESIAQETEFNDRFTGLSERRKSVDELQSAIDKQRNRLKTEPDSFRYVNAKQAEQEAGARYRRTQASNNPRIFRATQEVARIRQDDGDASLLVRVEALRRQITAWRREIQQDETALRAAEAEKTAAGREWLDKESVGLGRLSAQLEPALAARVNAEQRVAVRNDESEAEVKRLTVPNLVNKYTGLRRVTSDDKNPDAAATRAFEFALGCFFLVLELVVITSKVLMKKCALDYATAAVELLDQERITLEANSELAYRQTLAEAILKVKEEAIERWRDAQMAQLRMVPPTAGGLTQLWQDLDELAA